jgi:hypothetical protein
MRNKEGQSRQKRLRKGNETVLRVQAQKRVKVNRLSAHEHCLLLAQLPFFASFLVLLFGPFFSFKNRKALISIVADCHFSRHLFLLPSRLNT